MEKFVRNPMVVVNDGNPTVGGKDGGDHVVIIENIVCFAAAGDTNVSGLGISFESSDGENTGGLETTSQNDPRAEKAGTSVVVEKTVGMLGKKAKLRTESLTAYAMFLKQEKEKLGPKLSLNMPEINQKWKNIKLIPSLLEPYLRLAEEDKNSLGLNYRKDRTRIKNTFKSKPKQTQAGAETREPRKKCKKLAKISPQSVPDKDSCEPSVISMLEEVKLLDFKNFTQTGVKHEKLKKLVKLKVEADFQVKALNELDNSISYYQLKCKMLKKSLD